MNNHQLLAAATEHANSKNQAHLQLQAAANQFSPSNHSANEEQQQQQQQRQMALLNLFNSLSSLANNNTQQQQPHQLNQLQNVMAAAMMQQQQAPTSKAPPTPSIQVTNQKEQQQLAQVNLAGQQRINYCTICNKELCNKYFMKTHMLKMHGINLEMETSQNGSSDDDNQNENEEEQTQPEDCSSASQQQSSSSSSSNNNNNNWKKRKDAAPKTALAKQQATSVMNGFAGNSMGGVICDICNKELCSKYFLKVHKQNTHGIATDNYHDASPFAAIYPFAAGSLAALTLPTTVGAPFQSAAASSLYDQSHQSQLQQHQQEAVHEKLRAAKRARLGQNVIESKVEPPAAGQFESLYRLMLAQQSPQQPAAAATDDPIAAAVAAMNPLGALMCFGGAQQAAGAFMSPAAALSPAMIVDQILRNQHLFSQHHQQQQQPPQLQKQNNKPSNSKTTDRNNNGESNKTANSNKRYFSHYTEACPMCDRRFKSIKWLKTHMMNDHKHEIGTYMQSMMQYLYQTSKSQQQQQQQQLAAAASMAAFEQQQQQPSLFQHQQQYSAQFQSGQLMNVFNQRQFNLAPPFIDHTAQQQQQQQQQQHYRAGESFVYDARCTNNNRRVQQDQRQASLSPAECEFSKHLAIKRESSNSSSSSVHQRAANEEVHDLSANEPTTSDSPIAPCELHFDHRLDDRETHLSPGPTLALDCKPQTSGASSPAAQSRHQFR